MEKTLKFEVSELFYSIQGESTFAGFPCVFIRFSGCNLRCTYCDAKYTFEEKPTIMELEQILDFVNNYPDTLIEITGGEPLIQPHLSFLLDALIEQERKILIETNGSIDISTLPEEINIIMDIKCPESGSSTLFLKDNLRHITKRSHKRKGSCEIKFVISSMNDYKWSKQIVKQHCLHEIAPVLFSPVKGRLEPDTLAEVILKDRLPVRLQLQLHTFIWPDRKRGV